MNEEHKFPHNDQPEDSLQLAVQALMAQQAGVDELEVSIERVKARARQLEGSQPQELPSPPLPPVRSTSRTARWVVSLLIGTIMLMAGATLVLPPSASSLFAEVVARAEKARSVRMKIKSTVGLQQPMEGTVFLEPHRGRMEYAQGTFIRIHDTKQKQVLTLQTVPRLATLVTFTEDWTAPTNDPIDQLHQAAQGKVESIGEEILSQRTTRVYRTQEGKLETLVWVDTQTNLPVQITSRLNDPKSPADVRLENIVWNEPLDPALFSLTIPEGYRQMPATPQPLPSVSSTPKTAPDFTGDTLRDRAACQIVWSPTGDSITAVMRDPENTSPATQQSNQLRQWDTTTGKHRWTENIAGANFVAPTPDGQTLVTIIGQEIQIRSSETGQIQRTFTTNEPLLPISFSPDGKTLVAGIAEWGRFGGRGGDGSGGVEIWNIEQASLIRSITDDMPTTFVDCSVNGHLVASSSNVGPIKLWEVATGQLVRIIPGMKAASFSPDGESIACISRPREEGLKVGQVDIFRLSDGTKVSSIQSPPGTSNSYPLWIEYSPDGRSLVATDWNGTVTVWDVSTGQITATCDVGGGVLTAKFSPDGKTIALGCEKGELRLWKPAAEKHP